MKGSKSFASLKFPLVLLLILLLISGTFLTFSTGAFVLNFKQIGFTMTSTVQKGIVKVISSIENTFTAISQLATLSEEYQILTKKLENYYYLQRTNADMRQENERLNELLGFTQQYTYESYAAEIIGRDPNALYSAMTIDKGSKHGIKKNMPVVAIQQGRIGLVGKVVTVGLYTSIIMPIYDFNCNVSARIESTRDLGMVTGAGSPDVPLILSYIKKNVLNDLQYGDIIITSGENGNYVRGISIGTISNVAVVDYDTSLIISLIPTVDFSRLENVIVIDSDAPNNASPSTFNPGGM